MENESIVVRLRRWTHDASAQPASDLMEEAADEIEKLQSLTRFQDRVILSGDAATMTQSEKDAVRQAAEAFGIDDECSAKIHMTLLSLLERLSK